MVYLLTFILTLVVVAQEVVRMVTFCLGLCVDWFQLINAKVMASLAGVIIPSLEMVEDHAHEVAEKAQQLARWWRRWGGIEADGWMGVTGATSYSSAVSEALKASELLGSPSSTTISTGSSDDAWRRCERWDPAGNLLYGYDLAQIIKGNSVLEEERAEKKE